MGPDRAPLWRSTHITLQLRVCLVTLHGGQGSLAQIGQLGLGLETVGFGCVYTSSSVLRGAQGKC